MKDRFLSKNLEDATKRLEMFKNKLSLITDSNDEKIKHSCLQILNFC